MRIGYCQLNVVHSDIESNIARIAQLLENVSADLIVLPELCVSGYYFSSKSDLMRLSSNDNFVRVVGAFTEVAANHSVHLVAGISEVDNDDIYNSALLVGPEGIIGRHRKINLTRNEQMFSRGKDLEVFSIGDVKIGILICFDSWFPESFRILSLKGAQVVCCPSNFGGPWTLDVMKVRSLENKVFTVMCNRIGYEVVDDEEAHFRGESQIIDTGGNVLRKANSDEGIRIHTINPEEARTKDNIICNDLAREASLYSEYVSYRL